MNKFLFRILSVASLLVFKPTLSDTSPPIYIESNQAVFSSQGLYFSLFSWRQLNNDTLQLYVKIVPIGNKPVLLCDRDIYLAQDELEIGNIRLSGENTESFCSEISTPNTFSLSIDSSKSIDLGGALTIGYRDPGGASTNILNIPEWTGSPQASERSASVSNCAIAASNFRVDIPCIYSESDGYMVGYLLPSVQPKWPLGLGWSKLHKYSDKEPSSYVNCGHYD